MATETVAPHLIPTADDDQKVEKKVCEEIKADEECAAPRESAEVVLKTDDRICLEKTDVNHDEKIEPVEAAETFVDAPDTSTPVLDETKVGNDTVPDVVKQVVEAEKNADAAALSDVPLVEESKVECDPVLADVPEELADPVKTPEEVESSAKPLVCEAPKEPAVEIIEEVQVEESKTVDAPIEKADEALHVTTDKEIAETVSTDTKESPVEVEKPELGAFEVAEKPVEPCEVTEEVETKLEEVELEKSVEYETAKDEVSAAETVEPISIAEKGETEEEKTPVVEVKEVTQDEVGLEKFVEDEKKEVAEVDLAEKIQEEAAVVIEEEAKETEKDVVSTEPIKEDEKEVLNEVETVEKPAEEASEKAVIVGEENVETLEIAEKEICNVVTKEPTLPIEVDEKKEEYGLDVVEKVTEETAVEAEKAEERNAETEDGKTVVTVLEDEKKDLCDADVIEKSAYATEVKLEDVAAEESVVKITETKESEKKDEIFDEAEKLAEDGKVNVLEESDIKTVLEEVSTQQDKADANSYISTTPTEVIEKSYEEEVKDVEPAAEAEKEEHIKVETPCSVETKEENDVKVTTSVTEPLEGSKPSEPEAAKCDEPAALEKTIEDVVKPEENVELPAKDSDDTKPSEILSKEVPAKTSHKQSNTILSKVKHTLVKAKRVITGKSPSSKTPAAETKEEVKVK